MAKIEKITSRAPTLAEDDFEDAFLRPDSLPKTRGSRVSEGRPDSSSDPRAPRYQPEAPQEEDAFLRTHRRVPVRKSLLPRSRVGQITLAAGALACIAAFAWVAVTARDLLKHDPRFRIDSSDSIQITGNSQVTRGQLLGVFGSDIGRNVFFVPLAERRAELESEPWVQHATVMRVLPNEIRVAVAERTPVAFTRAGHRISLVDADGVILNMPAGTINAKHYSFPVVTGIDAAEPLSTRTARMRIYERFVHDLDAGGEKVSAQLSEVDLSDPEDVKAMLPESGSDILLHFGDADFLSRYHNYQEHLAEWRQQYPHLVSIDLRYERQVVLEMDKSAAANGSPADGRGKLESAKKALGKGDQPPVKGHAASVAALQRHEAGLPAGKTSVTRPVQVPPREAARGPRATKIIPYKDSYPATTPATPLVAPNGAASHRPEKSTESEAE